MAKRNFDKTKNFKKATKAIEERGTLLGDIFRCVYSDNFTTVRFF